MYSEAPVKHTKLPLCANALLASILGDLVVYPCATSLRSDCIILECVSLAGNKEVIEEKMKAPAQKGPVFHKGRFSVTSDDGELEVNISREPLTCPRYQ